MNQKVRNAILITLLVIVAFLALKFIHLEYKIESRVFFMPASTFSLTRTVDGNLITSLNNHIKGTVTNYGITEFERGDVVQFVLSDKVSNQKYLQKGDTLGWIYSNEEQKNLITLKGELDILKAELLYYTTGQKPEDVLTAESQLSLSKEQLSIQQKLMKRSERLFKDSVIAAQEYDIELNKLRVKEVEVAIAEARYSSITTGAKGEQEKLVRAKIANLESQVNQVAARLAYFTFTTPIAGIILNKQVPDTGQSVIAVADTSQMIGIVPVQLKERSYLKIGDNVNCYNWKGQIINMDNSVSIIDRKQAFYTTVLWDYNDRLLPGSSHQVHIVCDKITLYEYLKRALFPQLY